MKIQIGFKPMDLARWLGAANRVKTDANRESIQTPKLSAYDYRNLMYVNISSGRFPSGTPGLTKDYLKWKIEHGFSSNIGILKRDLLNALIVRPQGKGWFSGVDPNKRDVGGKQWSLVAGKRPMQIVKYAIWLEEGRGPTPTTGPQKARPIFMPTAHAYSVSGWMDRNERAFNRIKRGWR